MSHFYVELFAIDPELFLLTMADNPLCQFLVTFLRKLIQTMQIIRTMHYSPFFRKLLIKMQKSGQAWYAWRDSNPRPQRCERIELQGPC